MFSGALYLTYPQKPRQPEKTGTWNDGVYHNVCGGMVSGNRCRIRTGTVWHYYRMAVYAFLQRYKRKVEGNEMVFLFLLCGTSGADGCAADSALWEYTDDCGIKVFMILCIKINSVLF